MQRQWYVSAASIAPCYCDLTTKYLRRLTSFGTLDSGMNGLHVNGRSYGTQLALEIRRRKQMKAGTSADRTQEWFAHTYILINLFPKYKNKQLIYGQLGIGRSDTIAVRNSKKQFKTRNCTAISKWNCRCRYQIGCRTELTVLEALQQPLLPLSPPSPLVARQNGCSVRLQLATVASCISLY